MFTQEKYDQAVEAFRKGDLKDAERRFRDFARYNPESDLADNALYQLGMVLSFQGRKEEALEAFEKCLSQYAGTDAAPMAAREAEELREQVGADAEFQALALFHEGQNRAAKRDFAGAKAALQKCAEQYPRSSVADNCYLHLSTVLAIQGDFAEARRVLNQILQEFPGTDAAAMVPTALERLEMDERFR